MILKLLGPEDTYVYEYWQDDDPPSVIVTEGTSTNEDRVWVRGASSGPDDHRYYQQKSYTRVFFNQLKKV
jgi:hypothetical protein